MKNLILIVGPSGCGKSTVSTRLTRLAGLKAVASLTTRPPRYIGEADHEFVTQKVFDEIRDRLVAYTYFNGYEYGVTGDMLDDADTYVIDWPGVIALKKLYQGTKTLKTVFLSCPPSVCAKRMRERGDSEEKIASRLIHDEKAFDIDLREVDAVLDATLSAEQVAKNLLDLINLWEN